MAIIETYGHFDDAYFKDVNDNGKTLYTSGTTGKPKEIFKSPKNVASVCAANIKMQELTSNSRVYTCIDPDRAGGLFIQTLPALNIGASVTIKEFNAYKFVREIGSYTHTAITPRIAKIIASTKNFDKLDLSGIIINIGSEPVKFDYIKPLVERGARVTISWGASEVGPLASVSWINSMSDIERLESIAPHGTTPMGEEQYFEWKISPRGTLLAKGDITIYDDWWDTGDLVYHVGGCLFYRGRYGFKVDFDNPQK